jgi:hypothetical protein
VILFVSICSAIWIFLPVTMELCVDFITMRDLQAFWESRYGLSRELGEEISVDDGASGLPGRWNRRALGETNPRTCSAGRE